VRVIAGRDAQGENQDWMFCKNTHNAFARLLLSGDCMPGDCDRKLNGL
jgi:hypothetical protein